MFLVAHLSLSGSLYNNLLFSKAALQATKKNLVLSVGQATVKPRTKRVNFQLPLIILCIFQPSQSSLSHLPSTSLTTFQQFFFNHICLIHSNYMLQPLQCFISVSATMSVFYTIP